MTAKANEGADTHVRKDAIQKQRAWKKENAVQLSEQSAFESMKRSLKAVKAQRDNLLLENTAMKAEK